MSAPEGPIGNNKKKTLNPLGWVNGFALEVSSLKPFGYDSKGWALGLSALHDACLV